MRGATRGRSANAPVTPSSSSLDRHYARQLDAIVRKLDVLNYLVHAA